MGEWLVKHELNIGIKRIKEYGINVHFSKHTEAMAQDLIEALLSDTDMFCVRWVVMSNKKENLR